MVLIRESFDHDDLRSLLEGMGVSNLDCFSITKIGMASKQEIPRIVMVNIQ